MAFDATQDMKDQLLHQFKFSENIVKLVELLGSMFQDTLDVADYLIGMEDLDDYVGEQLDFWGELIGVKRPPAQETRVFTLYSQGEAAEHDPDNDHGFKDGTDGTVTTGGYLVGRQGLDALDGSQMSDPDYRYLIRQKAASFRTSPTHTNIFNYLLAFGSRCKIDEETNFELVYDPVRYYDLDHWEKNYVVTKGIKPAAISVEFTEKYRNEDPI